MRRLSASCGVNARRACSTRLPSWARTLGGMSVGAWVAKYTPTPFERMRRTVRSTCSISASDASSKRRCASSKKKAQLRLRQVADLGQDRVQLGEHPEHERAEQARLVHDVRQLEDADDAPAPSAVVRRRSRDVELGLAEEDVGALLLEGHDRADQHAERRARHPAVVGQDRLALVGAEVLQGRRQVGQVEQRQGVVVAVLEDERQDRGLGVVQVEHLAQQQRAEAVDGRPDLGAELAAQRQELDRMAGRLERPVEARRSARSPSGSSRRPGAARPVRSPLMSATKQGTPGLRQLARP